MKNKTKKMIDLFLIASLAVVGGCSLNTNSGYYEEPYNNKPINPNTSSPSTISPAPTPNDKPDSEESLTNDYYSDEDDYYVEDDNYYNSSSSGGMIYGSPSKSKTSGNTGMSSGTRGGIGSSGSVSGG